MDSNRDLIEALQGLLDFARQEFSRYGGYCPGDTRHPASEDCPLCDAQRALTQANKEN